MEARIKYKERDDGRPWDYKALLTSWFKEPLQFSKIEYADFLDDMVLATVEFDNNNMIYVLLPVDVFEGRLPWPQR